MFFNTAYHVTEDFEGGYSNDPDDLGQETFKGISRKFHPAWSGWQIIDSKKENIGFEDEVLYDEKLNEQVKQFYKSKYWDIFWGDKIHNKNVSVCLYDCCVNLGVVRTIKFLQISLNCLNRNEQLYDNLIVDGKMGSNTFRSLKIIIDSIYDVETLVKMIECQRGSHYIDLMISQPKQRKFARGWFKRI